MLPARRPTLPLLAVVALATGCAGRNFVRPTPDAFALGRTSRAEVEQQRGPPDRTATLTKNGATVEIVSYTYSAPLGEPLEEGVIPGRALAFFFANGILVGESFVSSFREDASNFDESRLASIVKGTTTRAEVMQLLGRPTGRFIPPVVKATSGEAIGYTYSATRGNALSGFTSSEKAVLISFDEADRVGNVEFMASATH